MAHTKERTMIVLTPAMVARRVLFRWVELTECCAASQQGLARLCDHV
jgi:hypothetical protein